MITATQARKELFEMIARNVPKSPPNSEDGKRYKDLLAFIKAGKAPRYSLGKKVDSKFIEPKDECCGGRRGHFDHNKQLMSNKECRNCQITFIRLVLGKRDNYPFTESCYRGFNLGDEAIDVHQMSDETFADAMRKFAVIGMPLWFDGEKTDSGFTVWMLHNKGFRITRPTEFQARKALWSMVYRHYADAFDMATKDLADKTKRGTIKDTGIGTIRGEKV